MHDHIKDLYKRNSKPLDEIRQDVIKKERQKLMAVTGGQWNAKGTNVNRSECKQEVEAEGVNGEFENK